MNDMIIKLHSGISTDGFTIEIPGQFKQRFDYGYDVSHNREDAERAHQEIENAKKYGWESSAYRGEKPYVSDLIFNIMQEYGIEPENVTVMAGNNTFADREVSVDTVTDFENTYLPEVYERFNN